MLNIGITLIYNDFKQAASKQLPGIDTIQIMIYYSKSLALSLE